MRKKWRSYLTITLLVFLIIFYFKELSTITFVCFGLIIVSHLYDLFKDKF